MDTESLTVMMETADIFAAARWWLVLMVLGAAATPLTATLLHRLPDRGYAFSKMIGLLLVSFLFWLLGSLGFLSNSLGSILLALLGVAGLSVYALRQMDSSLSDWLRQNRHYILVTELLFLFIFALWVWVRAQNPTIVATEKPMEFAFLNAVGRSPQFPPLDPWLSGFAISYYYFGYVMTSVIARLAAVPETIAFNLGIAWLVAGSAVGAFGLVYNLIASHKEAIWRQAVGLGLVAALAIPLAGNGQMALELLHARGVGSPEFWAWLDIRDISGPAITNPERPPRYTGFWWWWRSSRVIHEYHLNGAESGLEPIAEFPGFSFILGDMHPHVLALPFAFLSLAVALAWWLQPGLSAREWDEQDSRGRVQLLLSHITLPFWLFTALMLGGLSFLNTWDVLIHLFVVAAAFTLAQWRDAGWHNRLISQTVILTGLLVIPAILFYLPFYLGFRSQAGAPYILPMLMRPTRLAHFLVIFGLPLFIITLFLLTLAAKQMRRYWRLALLTGGGLILGLMALMLLMGWVVASSLEGAGSVMGLANEVGRPLTPLLPEATALARARWGIGAIINLAPVVIGARLAYPGVTLLLASLIGLCVMSWAEMFAAYRKPPTAHDEPLAHGNESQAENEAKATASEKSKGVLAAYPALPFVLLLIVTGALLTLGPEYLYLKDNFGQRLNTIFKFYYQAWVMLGAAAIVALYYLGRETRAVGLVSGSLYAVGLAVALLFPYYAVQARTIEYRGSSDSEFRRPPTLDGLAHVQYHDPDEYAAIMWLRENITGTPVIAEAVGDPYSDYGRVSARTGLPTLLGWANHQYQWRGRTPEPPIREQAIQQIYSNPDWLTARDYLQQYQVQYVYVGTIERRKYSPEGIAKFAQFMDVAYQNESVIIYRWQPGE